MADEWTQCDHLGQGARASRGTDAARQRNQDLRASGRRALDLPRPHWLGNLSSWRACGESRVRRAHRAGVYRSARGRPSRRAPACSPLPVPPKTTADTLGYRITNVDPLRWGRHRVVEHSVGPASTAPVRKLFCNFRSSGEGPPGSRLTWSCSGCFKELSAACFSRVEVAGCC